MSVRDDIEFDKQSFIKSSILPGIWLFLIPILTLLFFEHAEEKYDSMLQDGLLNVVGYDSEYQDEAQDPYINKIKNYHLSDEITSMSDSEINEIVGQNSQLDYFIFRWMIRLSWFAIGFGIVVIIAAGLSVKFSVRSQRAQYLSLSCGFFLLRIFSTTQVILQSIMLVSLSFWVTALWFEVYFVKIIGIIAIFALIAIFLIIKAIFTKTE